MLHITNVGLEGFIKVKGIHLTFLIRSLNLYCLILYLNMLTGTVKEYNRDRGFGFIAGDDGEDYFVHLSGLGPKLKHAGLRPGQRVAFDVDFDMKGDRAVNVRPA